MKTKFIFFCVFSMMFFWYCGDSPSITQSEQPITLKKIPEPKRQGDDYLSIHAMALNVTDFDGFDYSFPFETKTQIYVRAYVNGNAKTGNYVAGFADKVLPAQHFVTDSVLWIYDGPENSGEIENIKFKITEQVVKWIWSFGWQYYSSWENQFWTEEVDLYNPGDYVLDVITGDGEYLMIHANLLHGGM